MAAQAQKSEYAIHTEANVFRVALAGHWTLEAGITSLSEPLEETWANVSEAKPERIEINTSDVIAWDSAILPALMQLKRFSQAQGLAWSDAVLDEVMLGLLELAVAVPEKEGSQRQVSKTGLLKQVGLATVKLRADADQWLKFIGDLILGGLDLARGKMRFRWRDFLMTLQQVGPDALPIVTLISFLVGLIVAFLGAVVLVEFGASYYVSYLVGYGMLREMGALMVGIIMAGRTGAAFAAEIGSMKVNEEIRALETLGINPIVFIVFPRMFALVLMMPLLTLYADLIGVLAGMLVSESMLSLDSQIFLKGFLEAVSIADLNLGLIKGTVFGMIVAASGCMRGMESGSSADAVGKATTSAVVTAITLIVAANAFIDYLAATFGF